MNHQTIKQLIQLNTDFYSKVSQSFDRTRQYHWQGWEPLLAYCKHVAQLQQPRVLDIACGNARFAQFCSQQISSDLQYTGIDNNPNLLKLAQKAVSPKQTRLLHADIVTQLLSTQSLELDETFDLVVSFGFLHHIPSKELRKKFIASCTRLLSPKGIGCISFWQLQPHHPLRKRSGQAPATIDLRQLEESDYFLDWRKGPKTAQRFVHTTSSDEITSLFSETGATIVARYCSDFAKGSNNEYVIFTKTP